MLIESANVLLDRGNVIFARGFGEIIKLIILREI